MVWEENHGAETVQRIQYYPSGIFWHEGTGKSEQPYKYQQKEFIEMHGLDMYDFHWRSYCPFTARTTTKDPHAERYPWISPYSFLANNFVNNIDPDGRDTWRLNAETGEFTWVSDVGGTTTDHYIIERENEGSWVLSEPVIVTHNISIDRNGNSNINSFRIEETGQSTISAFHIPDAGDGELQSGFFLEPRGPSTARANQNQRIPEGTYNVRNHVGTVYRNVPGLSNDEVPSSRAILIHGGNTHNDTRGCLLPGTTRGHNFVGNSGETLRGINTFMNDRGHSNVRVNIHNVIR